MGHLRRYFMVALSWNMPNLYSKVAWTKLLHKAAGCTLDFFLLFDVTVILPATKSTSFIPRSFHLFFNLSLTFRTTYQSREVHLCTK